MRQVKSFIVEGDVKTYNGKKIHNIADKVDEQVNSFIATLKGEFIDVRIELQFQGTSGEFAFVTVIYEWKEAVAKSGKN